MLSAVVKKKKQKVRKWMKEKTEGPGLKFLRFKVVMGLFNFCLYLGVADIWVRDGQGRCVGNHHPELLAEGVPSERRTGNLQSPSRN